MSSLIVEVCKVDKVSPHPNADRMEICHVKGWQTCIGKGQFQEGDLCVYVPPDAIIPQALADRWGVTKYLAHLPVSEITGVRPDGGRVQVARLRGFPSYGFIMQVEDPTWKIGQDLVELLGITKWEPPLDCTDGDSEYPHPALHQYFTLENWRNFPEVFQNGEEVVLSEKLHGKNCRIGLIRDTKDDGSMIWRFMAGSHDVRRKEMQTQRKRRVIRNPDGTPVIETVMKPVRDESGKPIIDENGVIKEEPKEQEAEFFFEVTKRSQFWEVLDKPGIKELLLSVCNGQNNVVVFGEIFGSSIQDITYGFDNGQWDFRVFDITVNGRYLNHDQKVAFCDNAKVPMVPILYRGPYSPEIIEKYVSGPTTMCAPEKAGKFKGREGVVITATQEHTVSTEKKFFERASLKAVSFDYLERKEGTEFH